MNAKELLEYFDLHARREWSVASHETILRALRLLAAAEANDGSIPEMTKAVQEGRGIELGCQFERERNGLAARVRELELEVDSMRLNLKLLCAGFENGNAVYWVHDRPGIFNDALSAIDAERSEP